jgi:hypothetical protein
MNIFMLARGPIACARAHCDKHVVKMPLEYAEMLALAHWHREIASGKVQRVGYTTDSAWPKIGKRHLNHPCSLWARASRQNYLALFNLFVATLDEYEFRYGREHSYRRFVDTFYDVPTDLEASGLTRPYQAMPEQYRRRSAVEAYRLYYLAEKARFAKWTRRAPPDWWIADPTERSAFVSRATIGV